MTSQRQRRLTADERRAELAELVDLYKRNGIKFDIRLCEAYATCRALEDGLEELHLALNFKP